MLFQSLRQQQQQGQSNPTINLDAIQAQQQQQQQSQPPSQPQQETTGISFRLSGTLLRGQSLFQAQPQVAPIRTTNMPDFDYFSSSDSDNNSSNSSSNEGENWDGSESGSGKSNSSSSSNEGSENISKTGTTTTKRRKRKGKDERERNASNEKEGGGKGATDAVPKLSIGVPSYTGLDDAPLQTLPTNSGNSSGSGGSDGGYGSNSWTNSGTEFNSSEESLAQSQIDSLSWELPPSLPQNNNIYTRLDSGPVLDHSGSAESLGAAAQPLTVKDWFMILDTQIRSSGVNVSLSGLYLKKFEEEDITMHTLPFLTEKDLVDMGVTKMGHRKLIMSSIAKLPKSGQSVFVKPSYATSLRAPQPLLEMSDAEGMQQELPAVVPHKRTTLFSQQQQQQQQPSQLKNPLVQHGLMQRHQSTQWGDGNSAELMSHLPPVATASTVMSAGSMNQIPSIFNINDVKIGEKIGEGSFGEVYQAFWHGNVVAAKKTKKCDINNDIASEYTVNK